MKKLIIGIFILSSLFGALGYAEDEIVERAQNEANLKKMNDEMNASCESSISVTINWDSFAKADWRDYSVSSYCGAPVETLMDFCAAKKGASKAYIKEKVKSITCLYGGEGKRALNIKSGEISNVVDFKASNLNDFVRATLVEKL